MSNIMEDITEHEIYLILLNMLLNKEVQMPLSAM